MKVYQGYDHEEVYNIDLEPNIKKQARQRYEKENPLQSEDYEKRWNEQQEKMEEWEYKRLLLEGKVKILYRTSTTKSKNVKSGKEILEAQIYPAFLNVADMPRTKRKCESSPSQSNLNDKNSRRQLVRLVNINFSDGDLWCTFGWNNDNLPCNEERARKDIRNFIARINRRRKKAGLENIKYIYVLAFCDYERPHFHIIMSGDGVNRDELEVLWGKCDRPNTRRIKVDDDLMVTGLATYIARNPRGSKRWCPSKNLKKPDKATKSYSKFKRRKVERIARDYTQLQEEMEKAYKGYKFIDREVKYNGINSAFYIYARMVRN
jgi:hypothetical protein